MFGTSDLIPPSPRLPSHHRYACLSCRSRKIRCDRISTGCTHCRELGAQCTYAARRPRTTQKPHRDPAVQRVLLPINAKANNLRENEVLSGVGGLRPNNFRDHDEEEEEDILLPREMRDASFEPRSHYMNADNGRLFVAQGKSRYVSGEKVEQVASLVAMLTAEPSSNEPPSGAPKQAKSSDEDMPGSAILRTSTGTKTYRSYFPTPSLMIALWDFYALNVDAVVKIMYRKSTDKLVKRASASLAEMDPPEEAFLFAIWFAAVSAMSPEECLTLHGEEKPTLVRRYRNAAEHALAQSNWMTTQAYTVLQALILLTIFAPPKESRSTWILTGTCMNIAQAMGLHSDAASFGLDVIEIEVRRRIWWSICQLDYRIAEDCGLEPHIVLSADTKLPLNINDADLDPGQSVSPLERDGFTEMTFPLIRIEMARTILDIKKAEHLDPAQAREVRESVARKQIDRYENIYLRCVTGTARLQQLWEIGTCLLVAKLWKITLVGFRGTNTDREEIKERLFIYNTNILEAVHQLPNKLAPFGWSFRCKYTQWHAMAYLLMELCTRTEGRAVDRAWDVINRVFHDLGENDKGVLERPDYEVNCKTTLWPPLQRLLKRARALRAQALQYKEITSAVTTPSTLTTSDFSANILEPTERSRDPQLQVAQEHEGLLGDPFFGSDLDIDFSDKVNWDQLETFVNGLYSQQDLPDTRPLVLW